MKKGDYNMKKGVLLMETHYTPYWKPCDYNTNQDTKYNTKQDTKQDTNWDTNYSSSLS